MVENLFFDWYSASIDACIEVVQATLIEYYPHCTLEPASARHGYERADKFVDQAGETMVTFMYGGDSQGSRVLVFGTGANAHKFAMVVRDAFPDHQLVRADVALDFDEAGAYQSLFNHGIKISRQVSVSDRYVGPAGAELADHCPKGRTLYLGSRTSVSMMRIYEKGKKDDPTRPNWSRVEFEFKPKNEPARLYYAKASLAEIVSATKLGQSYFTALGAAVTTPSVRPGTVRVPTSQERAMGALKRQYMATMLKQLELCGGDLHQFALTLLDAA